MAAPKGGTRERILDAAEALFAERGFDATSIREIADRSGDTIGTLSYHFKSKDQLLIEVVHRRFDVLADLRRNMYAGFRARSRGTPGLEDAITAITVPFLERAMCGGEAWQSYTSLLARLMYDGHNECSRAVAELTDPVAKEFLGWVKAAAPQAPAVEVGFAYQFIIGCLMDCCSQMESDRFRRLTDGASRGSTYPETMQRFLKFVIAGAKALIEPQVERP